MLKNPEKKGMAWSNKYMNLRISVSRRCQIGEIKIEKKKELNFQRSRGKLKLLISTKVRQLKKCKKEAPEKWIIPNRKF